jgi:phosphodiesterase/alkaline phosphatase D-like protein
MKRLVIFLVVIATAFFANGQALTGTKTIKTTGGDYSSIAAAVSDLNSNGVGTGGVTFNIDAGFTETLSGKITLTATGTASNPIIFQKYGSGNNPVITSYTGSVSTPAVTADGFWVLAGSDYVTIDGVDLLESSSNTTTTTVMEFGYGLFKASVTDGCQYVTIKNCTITLNTVQNTSWTAPGHNGSTGIAVLNGLYNTTGTLTITSASGSNSYNKFYSNTIKNCNAGIVFIGYVDGTSPYTNGDTGNDIGGSSSSTGNTILNFGGGASANPATGIFLGAQNSVNCRFNTLNNNNGSGTNHATTLRGIYWQSTYVASSGTCSNNTITVKCGATTSQLCGIEFAASSNSSQTVNINYNNITTEYSSATSGVTYAIYANTAAPGTLSISNNIINSTSAATSGSMYPIYNTCAVTSSLNLDNNKITGITLTAASTSVVTRGIYCTAGANTCTTSISYNKFSGYNISGTTGGSGETDCIYHTGTPLNQTITNDTFNNLTIKTSGSIYLIYNSYSAPVNGSKSIQNNTIVTGVTRTLASGSLYGYYDNGSSSPTVVYTISGNNFSNILSTVTGTGTFYGIFCGDGATSPYPKKSIYNNTVSNVSYNTTGSAYAFNLGYIGDGSGSSGSSIYNNTVSNFSAAGTVYGISLSSTISPTYAPLVYSNTVNTVTSTGASSTVYGFYLNGGGAGLRFYKNITDSIVSTGTTGNAYGIAIVSATNSYIYNNFISNIRATASSNTDAVRGISITSTSSSANIGLYYNSVYLSGTSSSSTTFGSSGIYHTVSTTATTSNLDMRNNIIINNTTPVGTGYAVAFRRSGTALNNFSSNSDYNCLYAGTPGTYNVIFYDGTNIDQTISAYITRVSNRESNSFTENSPFINTSSFPYDLHLSTSVATQCESAGTPISSPLSIATDIDNDSRNSTFPDIGADEGTFTLNDVRGPIIQYTALQNTASTTSRSLTATITDISGVPTSGTGLPKLYWKAGSASSYTAVTASSIGNNQYTFSFGNGVSTSDTIFYFIMAQDSASTPNVSCSPSAGASGFTYDPPAASTPPSSPSSYRILATISGTFYVGVGQTYTTLTAAITDLNNKIMTGAVNFILTDTLYGAETYPITINSNGGNTSANKLTIKPDTSVTCRFWGTSTSGALVINGMDYVTIDGSNSGGTDKNLTIINNNNSATTPFVIGILNNSGDPSRGTVIKNCIIKGGGIGSSSINIYGIILSASGGDFDSTVIQNNSILKTRYGIQFAGASGFTSDNGQIIDNIIGSSIDSLSNSYYGIISAYTNNLLIEKNEVMGQAAGNSNTAQVGIYLSTLTTNSKVKRNIIHDIYYNGTGGYGVFGIRYGSDATTFTEISNNLIYNLKADGDPSSFSFLPSGIYINSGGNIGIYHNSIYLSGNFLSNSYVSYSACVAVNSTITALDIRDNIFKNSQQRIDAGTGSNKTYAVYSLCANTAYTALNFNDYFVNGINPNIGYIGSSNRSTLSAWITGTTQDANSISADPSFVSASDFHPTAFAVNNAGTPVSLVTIDFTGTTRNSTKPDLGAYEISFTPTVVTGSKSSVTATGAVLAGTSNPKNEGPLTYTFDYGSTAAYGSSVNASPNTYNGITDGNFAATLTGLTPNSTYHYRLSGTYSSTTINGDDSSFSTTSIAPSVTTDAASTIQSTSAVLNGTVNANNASTTIGFDFGTTTAYGSTFTADQSPLSTYSNTAVTYTVTGLIPNTTYHYKAHATNFVGTTDGADQSFTSQAIVPTVETHSATSVTDNSATLNGAVNANNASSTVSIEWGTSTSYGNSVTPSQSPVTGTTLTSVSAGLTGLTPNTTYHYRVVATNMAGTINGPDSTFHTAAIVPVVTTGTTSTVTSTGATLNGTVNANNASTTASFNYGTTTSYGTNVTADQSPVTGTGNTAISATLSGLIPNTTYHYQATGSNIAGTTNGVDSTFYTPAVVPTVTTNAGSSITATGATLNGTVNANNASSTVSVEWGTSTSYGNSVTPSQSPVTGITNTSVNYSLTGIEPNTTYHYRVVATNMAGTSYGSDESFNTTAIAPDVTTNYPTSVGDTNATLNGTVNANNDATSAYIEWGLTTAYGNTLSTTPSSITGYTNTSISGTVTTLLPNSTYHYRVVATNSTGTSYGSDISFSTSSLAPTAYTNSASSISKYEATLNGDVNPNNNATTVTFEYGADTTYGTTVTAAQSPLNGSSAVPVTYNLTGIAPNSTYHYRVIASSSSGTTYGTDITFSTPTVLADAVNTGAGSITATTATISGTVNPNNTYTVVHFEYGATNSYGLSAVAYQSPLTGWTDQTVSYDLTNLIPNYTYHYRIKAMNFVGTAYSYDTSFSTSAIAPSATTGAASSVSTSGATFNATINAQNSTTTVTFEYGTTTSYGTTVTAYQSPVSGYTNSAVTYILTGLYPNTTYHYRVIAQSTPGTTYGYDTTFTTPSLIPSVTTNSYSSLTSNSADLNGTVNANNASTTVTFEYGTSTSYGTTVNATPNTVTGMTNTSVSYSLSGLDPNTTYHYRVVGVNSAGTSYGSDISFTTPAVAPTITTVAATSIASSSAVLNGTVNANNAATTAVFDWGTSTSYGNTVTVSQSPISGMTTTSVNYSLSNLTPNTTYYFRLRGSNVAGSANGADLSFTTSTITPTATTNNASSIYPTGATFNGTVNPNNASTTVSFDYGTSTSYGTTVTASQSPVTGISNVSVSNTVSSLVPNTTYHFRVVATNSAGTTTGSDKSFNTPAVVATVTTAAATSITASGATLNGTVNANNASTTVTFEYGTSTTYGTTVTATQSPVTGVTATNVSAAISGLLPNTTYHFRTVGNNSAGISYGNDFTLLTPAVVPTATTNSATSVVFNGATLNGVVNANNSTTAVRFEYGTTTAYGSVINALQTPVSGTSNTNVSAALGNLLPNTTYHFRVVAINSAGRTDGSDFSFTTSAIAATVNTANPSAIQANGATLNGFVYANNSATTVTFDYGTSTSYGSSVTASQSPVNGMVNTPVSYTLSGLIPNTTYHYRVVGTNAGGTANGNDAQFTTTLIPPSATSNVASAVNSNSATLNGVVNANNAATTISFEYGMTLSYGTVLTASPASASGTANTSASYNLSGLLPNATYHYRIIATNAAGTVYGADQSFTTTAVVPVATTSSATTVQANHAVMNGIVNANNDNTSITFEYGTTISYGTTVNAVPSSAKGMNNTNVSFELWNLLPNQLYHYRVVATNSAGTTNGLDATFNTNTVVPVAITDPPNSPEETQAQLNGTVNAQNASTTVTIQWGTTTSYGNTVSPTPSTVTGVANTSVSFILSGLTPNTEYHYRVAATNVAGTSYGIDRMFRTGISAPVVTTAAASAITTISATLNGTVNANNTSTDMYFEYGTTTSYGTTIQATPDKAIGTSVTNGIANITGLQPGVTYHFRIVGNNSYTTIMGNDMTFTTNVALPTVVTNAISDLTDISVTSGGNVTYNGGSAVTARGVCWSNSPNPTVALSTKTSDGTGSGYYTSAVTGLTQQTHYFLRAYATNSVGTSYGEQVTFNTLLNDIFEDVNGNTVKIYAASHSLFVDILSDQPLNNAKIFVYDMNGKLMMKANAAKGMNTFDMTGVAKGAYLVNVVIGKNIYHNKVFMD